MDETQEPEAVQKNGKSKKLAIGAVAVVAVVAAVAFASSGNVARWSDEGQNGETAPVAIPAANADASTAPPPAAPTVAAAAPEDTIRGVVKSRLEAVISSKITAKVISMPFREGQSFSKGALLVSFDCSTLRAQLNAANAATSAYRKTYETNAELDAFQAVGRNEVEVSKANMDRASAEARAIATQLSDCAIHAPFAGFVTEKTGHAHEVAASGQPLMRIQNGSDLEVQLIVPSGWLTWLKPGTDFDFRIDETGETVKASVTRLGGSVDPVSKTLRIIAALQNAAQRVLPGMSGSANFEAARTAAASPSGANGNAR